MRSNFTFKKYRAKAKEIPLLSAEEEAKLIKMAIKGDSSAVSSLVKSHFRSVVNIATLYRNRGVAFEDIVDEGNLGLLRALKTYDLSKGFRFISYASWWIRHYILKFIYQQSRATKVPIHKLAGRKTFIKIEQELSQKLGRLPTTEEIAEALNVTVREVTEAMNIAQSDISLDTKFGKEEEYTLVDFIKSSDKLSDDIEKKLFVEEIVDRVRQLEPQQRRIIELRFGLRGKSSYTLQDIGHIFSVSRERIRQIEIQALQKLRRLLE